MTTAKSQKHIRKKYQVSLPYALNRKAIYILPTWYGILFIMGLGAMLVGSVNYNNNLGFLLTFLLGGMAFVSIFYTYRNLTGIQIISVRAAPVFAGQSAVFEFHIQADIQARAGVSFRFGDVEEICEEIHTDKENTIRIRLAAPGRGILTPGLLRITTRFPLGLFYAWSRFHIKAAHCLVYPKPLAMPMKFAKGFSENNEKDKKADHISGADDFQGLRTYQPGDSLRHIDWKAFSRGQGLFIKNFARHTGTSILLDWYSFKGMDTEQILSALCEMVISADRLLLVYGMKLPGKNIAPGKGETHKRNCLKALALFGI